MLVAVLKRLLRAAFERTNAGYRFLIKRTYKVDGPHGRPDAPWICGVLRSSAAVQASLEQVRRLGLPPVSDLPKNWDSLAAVGLVLSVTGRRSRVFDAGGESYSMVAPWLSLYGYTNLTVGNLVFKQPVRKGPIRYVHADITATEFPDAYFDAVTCLSVIEHGVDVSAYFREMFRILRPGGILITSTDYWDTAIDTEDQQAYGTPIRIFTRDEIRGCIQLATSHGFRLLSPLQLECQERVVHWREHNLQYTFVMFSLLKMGEERPIAEGREPSGGPALPRQQA